MEKLNLSYLKVNSAKSYSFYMIPRELIDNPIFDSVDYGSKILYSLMLNRASLSASNPDFVDDKGNVFIIYTVEQVIEDLRCSNKTAIKFFAQLETIGLIERHKHGQGKPSPIYVKDFASIPIQKCKKYISRSVKNTSQEMNNLHGSNTDLNNTDLIYNMNDVSIIHSEAPQTTVTNERTNENTISKIRKQVAENISLEHLLRENPRKQKEINELYELIVETMYSRKKTFRIAREELDSQIVKEVFAKLDYTLLEYVLQCLKKTTTGVTNTKAYLLTTLYNARNTIDNQLSFEVQHDLSIVK